MVAHVPYVALAAAETTGTEFWFKRATEADCFLVDFVDGSTVRIQRQIGDDWHDLDATGEATATWTSAGGGLVPFLGQTLYRVLVTGGAGAVMHIVGRVPAEATRSRWDPVDGPVVA